MRRSFWLLLLPFLAGFMAGCGSQFRLPKEQAQLKPVWPYHRGNAAATGSVGASTFNGKLNVIWETKSNDKPAGPLTVYSDLLVYPGTRNKLKFFRLNDGHNLGYIKVKGTPQTGLVAKDSLAFYAVGPNRSILRCTNLLNRHTVWEAPVKDALSGSIIVEDMLIAGSSEGVISAYDLGTGKSVWRYGTEARFSAPPSANDSIIFIGSDDDKLCFLSAESGNEVHQIKLDAPMVSPAAYDKGTLYLSDLKGAVYCLDVLSQSIVWRRELGAQAWAAPAINEEKLFVVTSDGKVSALSKLNGETVWQFDATDVFRASPLVVGDFVIAGNLSGWLFSFDAESGRLVDKKQLNGPIVVSPVSDGQRVYVATDKGMITCFGEDDDNVRASH